MMLQCLQVITRKGKHVFRTPFRDPCPFLCNSMHSELLACTHVLCTQGTCSKGCMNQVSSAHRALHQQPANAPCISSRAMRAAQAFEQDRTTCAQPGATTAPPLTSQPAGDAKIAEVLDLIAWQTPLTWHRGNACTEDVWPPILQEKVSCWPPQPQAWLGGVGC